MLRSFLFISILWLAQIAPSHALSVLPMQLNEIVASAHLVFQGTCTANRSERDAQTGMIVTYTTFEISDVLKGGVGPVHTIKQVGGELDDASYHVEGVPSFAVGQEYMVFLYGVSGLGFSSPVGLGQGQFSVTDGPLGKQLTNGRDFNELIPNQADWGAGKPAPAGIGGTRGEIRHLGVDGFKQIVRRQLGGAK